MFNKKILRCIAIDVNFLINTVNRYKASTKNVNFVNSSTIYEELDTIQDKLETIKSELSQIKGIYKTIGNGEKICI